MTLSPKRTHFIAFTAIFAALAMFVFWGTWSTDFAPIMPDHPITWPEHYLIRLGRWFGNFCHDGKFEPLEFFALVGSPYWWQEFKYAFCLYLSGLGLAYFLLGRGLSPLASYGGGLMLAFSGYWCTLFSAGHYGWFQLIAYAIFAFGLIDRKRYLLLGAVVAWGSFHQPDLWLLFTVLTAAYFIFRAFETREFDIKGVLIAAAVFLLIGAPSFYSAIVVDLAGRNQQIAESVGATTEPQAGHSKEPPISNEARWIFVTNWSMPPEDTLELAIPRIHGDTSCKYTQHYAKRAGKDTTAYTGRLGCPKQYESQFKGKSCPANYRQHSLYVGFVTCILALIGIALNWRKPVVIFFAAAALIAYLCSLGRYFEPLYRVIYMLPFGDYLRAPVKWHHLTEFCIAVLAAFGVDGLLRAAFSRARVSALPKIALAVIILAGVCDLARVDAKYCAPVPIVGMRYREAHNPESNKVPPVDFKVLPFVLGLISVVTTAGVAYFTIKSACNSSRNMI